MSVLPIPNFPSITGIPSVAAIALAGVPPLLNATQMPLFSRASSTSQANLPTATAAGKWGIYKDGAVVIVSDNVTSFEYKKDWRIANYPQEQGAFQSYNKVTTPYDAKITMTQGGRLLDRQDFLTKLEEIAASLDLYDVLTPEKTYVNANIAHIDYERRTTNGAGMITADIWLTEVRMTVTEAFSSTKDASGASVTNVGSVQAVPATPAQMTAARSSWVVGSGDLNPNSGW